MHNLNNLFIEIQNKNNDEVLKILDEVGIDAVDNYKRTALMNAALHDNASLIKLLIERKANMDLQDKLGFTALHFALQEANLEATKLLLEHGADPNIADAHGNTPAAVAIVNWKAGKNFEPLKLLIQYKADLTIKNTAGRCALDLIPENMKKQLQIA